MPRPLSFNFSPLYPAIITALFTLSLSCAVTLASDDNAEPRTALKALRTNKSTRNEPKKPSKPISHAALLKAIKIAAEGSTSHIRLDLMKLIEEQVKNNGVDFLPTSEEEEALRQAGASPELLNTIQRKGQERAVWLEQQTWDKLQLSDQSNEIQAFLEQYPSGLNASAARARLAQLRWEAVQHSEQADDFSQYLAAYPDSANAAIAQARLEQLDWQTAQTRGQAADFADFHQRYPSSQYAVLAKHRLAQFAWEELKHSRDLTDFMAFVEQYPQGPLAEAAQIRIEQLRWELTLAGGKVSDFEQYLSQYPNGHFASTANTRLDRLLHPSKYVKKGEEGVPAQLAEKELRQHVTKAVLPALTNPTTSKRSVKVRVVLTATGEIQTAEVVSGSRSLRAAAVAAVQQWTFRPVERMGKPVMAEGVLTILFDKVADKTSDKTTDKADDDNKSKS